MLVAFFVVLRCRCGDSLTAVVVLVVVDRSHPMATRGSLLFSSSWLRRWDDGGDRFWHLCPADIRRAKQLGVLGA